MKRILNFIFAGILTLPVYVVSQTFPTMPPSGYFDVVTLNPTAVFDIRGKLLVRRAFFAEGVDPTIQIGNIAATSLILKIDGDGTTWSGMVVPEMKNTVIHLKEGS